MHNIKRKIIKNIYILSLCLSVICISCTKKEINKVTKDEQAYDMFYRSVVDSISTSPISIKQKALIRYASSHDSLIAHKYLSVAMTCCFYTMNSDSVMILANDILNFAGHNKKNRSDGLYLECDSYNAMGNICSRNGSLEKAIVYYQKAFDILLLLKDNRKIIDIIINIADTNNRLGTLDVGALWYRKALLYNDSLKMPEKNKIPVYYGLAQIYTSFRDFKRCNYYYNLVAKHYNDMTSFEKHVYLNNRGNSYYFMNDYETAIKYFKRVIMLSKAYPEMVFEKNLAWLNLGDCYLQLNDLQSARKWIDLCSPFFDDSGNMPCQYYLKIQELKLAMLKKDYAKAKYILNNTLLAESVPFPDIMSIRNKYVQEFYELSGDYKNAYNYLNKNRILADSVRSERSAMRTADLSSLYQQDSTIMAQKFYISTKEEELNKLHYYIIYWTSFFIAFIVCVVIFYRYQKKKRDLKVTKALNKIQAMHLENLRNRLSPHFVFNILNQEISTITDEKKDRMYYLVKLIRQNLEIADKLYITLEEELNFLNLYLNTIKEPLGKDFKAIIDIDPKINEKTKFVPSMSIQIPVENSIKHALSLKDGEKRLYLTVRQLDKGIEIEIIDNGGGYKQNNPNKGTGTGLKVLTQSIHILNRRNEEKISLSINNVTLPNGDKGCKVVYFIPDNYNYVL